MKFQKTIILTLTLLSFLTLALHLTLTLTLTLTNVIKWTLVKVAALTLTLLPKQ